MIDSQYISRTTTLERVLLQMDIDIRTDVVRTEVVRTRVVRTRARASCVT